MISRLLSYIAWKRRQAYFTKAERSARKRNDCRAIGQIRAAKRAFVLDALRGQG